MSRAYAESSMKFVQQIVLLSWPATWHGWEPLLSNQLTRPVIVSCFETKNPMSQSTSVTHRGTHKPICRMAKVSTASQQIQCTLAPHTDVSSSSRLRVNHLRDAPLFSFVKLSSTRISKQNQFSFDAQFLLCLNEHQQTSASDANAEDNECKLSVKRHWRRRR